MFTPRNAVRGARGAHVVKTSSMPPRSGAAGTSPEANSALASEPKTIVPSSSSVQCSGWMPKRSRTSVSRRGPGSHQANANWPFSWSSAARPSRSSRRCTTSVSLVVSQVDPVTCELGAQLRVVEDLAVVDDERPTRVRLHRLPAVLDVEDRQTCGDEAGALTERQSEPVGPAVADRPRHPAQGDLLHRPARHPGARCRRCRTCQPAARLDRDRVGVQVGRRVADPLDLRVRGLDALGVDVRQRRELGGGHVVLLAPHEQVHPVVRVAEVELLLRLRDGERLRGRLHGWRSDRAARGDAPSRTPATCRGRRSA